MNQSELVNNCLFTAWGCQGCVYLVVLKRHSDWLKKTRSVTPLPQLVSLVSWPQPEWVWLGQHLRAETAQRATGAAPTKLLVIARWTFGAQNLWTMSRQIAWVPWRPPWTISIGVSPVWAAFLSEEDCHKRPRRLWSDRTPCCPSRREGTAGASSHCLGIPAGLATPDRGPARGGRLLWWTRRLSSPTCGTPLSRPGCPSWRRISCPRSHCGTLPRGLQRRFGRPWGALWLVGLERVGGVRLEERNF